MTTSTTSSRLGSVPQEVLEHIAFCAATQNFVGPPSGLPPLLLTCRDIHRALCFETNPYLFARVFYSKFDTRSVFRRLGPHASAPRVLAEELKKRWTHLKRIRSRANSRIARVLGHATESESPPTGAAGATDQISDLLWLAYLMMLENDGKNERQLLGYAEMDVWLMEYWFDDEGASEADRTIFQQAWPVEDEGKSIAMWLFWLLLRPDFVKPRLSHIMTVMRLIALAANHYPICHPSWAYFYPRSEEAPMTIPPRPVTHFSETRLLNPPAIAPAAVLAFLTVALQVFLPGQRNHASGYSFRSPASLPLSTRRSEDWDTDWHRCVSLGRRSDSCGPVTETFALGSLEGVWEGVFAYTEFDSYTMLLSGAPPSVFDRCLIGHHRQTWKLREYYFFSTVGDSGREHGGLEESLLLPSLTPGDPLRAHFPAGTRFQDSTDSLQVHEPGREAVRYQRPSKSANGRHNVIDIIILGEGHSSWGQFNLYGRVRPLDGLVSFSKEYVEGDRGRWLYRGYLVGGVDGYISGRWRDPLSPSDVQGYEGCFMMGRRK